MNTNENVLKSYQQAPDIPDPLGIQWIHPDFTECIMNIVMHHLVADNLKAMQCSQIELKYSIAFRNWKLFKLLLLERAQMVRRAEKNSKSSYFFADEFPSCTGHEFGIGLQILSRGGIGWHVVFFNGDIHFAKLSIPFSEEHHRKLVRVFKWNRIRMMVIQPNTLSTCNECTEKHNWMSGKAC